MCIRALLIYATCARMVGRSLLWLSDASLPAALLTAVRRCSNNYHIITRECGRTRASAERLICPPAATMAMTRGRRRQTDVGQGCCSDVCVTRHAICHDRLDTSVWEGTLAPSRRAAERPHRPTRRETRQRHRQRRRVCCFAPRPSPTVAATLPCDATADMPDPRVHLAYSIIGSNPARPWMTRRSTVRRGQDRPAFALTCQDRSDGRGAAEPFG